MATWQQTRLGEISQIYSGFAFRSQDLGEHGIPVVKIGNIQNKRVSPECADHLPEELCIEKLKRYFLRQGDTLIAMTGAGSVGKVGKMPRVDGRFLVNQRVAIVRPDDSRCDSAFVYFALSQDVYETKLYALGLGAGQPNVSAKEIGDLEIPFPPLPVQRRIAGILSAYDELMENSQRRIRRLEAMARALYREWFVHFKYPGHEKVKLVRPPSRPGEASAKTDGDIPQGWEAIPFEKLLASMTGGDWGSDQPTERESAEVSIVRGTDFEEVAYGGGLRTPVRFIKPSSLKSRGLRPGDVIVENSINAKSRCIGTPLLVDAKVLARIGRDAVAASFCKVFRLHDPRLAPLVHLHFRRLREDARMEYYQNVAANGIGNFQAQKFAKEEHMILPKDEALRSKLIGGIAAMFESISVLSFRLSNLRRTRDLLLPRLLSGQLKVLALNEETGDK